jgi:hypothetical protein
MRTTKLILAAVVSAALGCAGEPDATLGATGAGGADAGPRLHCSYPMADCDGLAANGCETNLETDVHHCGTCERACALPHAVAACTHAACVIEKCEVDGAIGTCAHVYADCDGDASNGCEINLAGNHENCGACGKACAPQLACLCGSECRIVDQ